MQTPVEMDLMNKSPIGQDESKKNGKFFNYFIFL